MLFSLLDNVIEAGILDILLDGASLSRTMTTWSPFYSQDWLPLDTEKRKLNMIKQLQTRRIIQATCYHAANTKFLRIRIYVILTDTGRDSDYYYRPTYSGSAFLDLMLLLDRRREFFLSDDSKTNHYIRKPLLTPFVQQDHPSLLDLFIHMPSPRKFDLPDSVDSLVVDFLNKVADMTLLPGMKTKLYQYQKASLWKILQRELAPLEVPRPVSIQLLSVDGTMYYYDLLAGTASLTQGVQTDVAGGIICEDMGTGKTCICLAAIMATKQVLPPLHAVSVKTDFSEYYHRKLGSTEDSDGVKSLCALAGAQTMLSSVDWRPYCRQLPAEITFAFERSAPYYEWSSEQLHPLIDRPQRRQVEIPILKVYLSAATLVVVPDNLVAQWTGEIYKHICDGQLDFIVLDSKKQPIPPPHQLIHLDMVLISQSRFSHENTAGGFDFQGVPRECDCPYFGATRMKNCTCPIIVDKPKYTSSLLQIHWKRVIVDEGHSLSARNTRQSNLSAKLFSCWSWICTGTPTQNLTEVAVLRTRQEGIADDLARLGILLTDILKLQPYTSSKKLWPQLVVKPFIMGKVWAADTVNSIMCRTMIRNQRSSIENEVILPPLHCRTVELDFDYYQWLAHNCQIAMINLNAILSKREGPDYLFSKNNQKALRETVSNLRQSCTWHSIDLASLHSSYANCVEKLRQADEGTEHYGTDEPGLRQLKQLFELALGDPVFIHMMSKHEISFVVQGLPNLMKETWGWCQGARGAYLPVSSSPWDDHCLVSGDIVVDLMHDVTSTQKLGKDIYVYDSSTMELESTEVYEKRKRMQALAVEKGKQKRSKSLKDGSAKINRDRANSDKNISTINPHDSNPCHQQQRQQQGRIQENTITVSPPLSPLPTINSATILNMDCESEGQNDSTSLTYYTRSVFSDVRVLCSTSSKINYLVNQILSHHTEEKCIIFSQYYNEMQEIYLALQLVKVRVLMYLDTSMSSVSRSQTIMTFNTSDNANVMLMAVQKAAYGIDLSSASRVYFVSPVWQNAMEQQAIKRAHRIGQTRPVYVETLVIRNSIEDALLKRRNAIGAHQDNSKVDFYSDKRLQNILNHANIVPKPAHIQQLEDGSYYQSISFLDKPIWLIPRHLSPTASTPPSTPKKVIEMYSEQGMKRDPDLDVVTDNSSTVSRDFSLQSTPKRRKVVSFN